mgnify:CR=1 FL=1
MQFLKLAKSFGKNDLKLMFRDRFIIGLFFFVIYIAVALRYLLPWLNGYFERSGVMPSESFVWSLADLYPMLIAFFVLFQGALMAGVIFGFIILDEKDDKTLTAILVTPVPLKHYITYRVVVPTILGFVIVMVQMLFINLAMVPLWQLVLISIGAGFTAPIGTMFYATFAENKVQGFAISKFASFGGWFMLIGWFIVDPYQWLFSIFPPFLISKAYWMALGQSSWWIPTLLAGIVLQVAMVIVFIKQFQKAAYRL